ncbi:MAG: ATP-binding cassette domain-containing protein, partial [Chlamydiia bacterium]|nr:ATP-binding cassette domain-containing protein [Chlamydiia bacterium]
MSSNIVITVEGISKRFAIGGSKEATVSLRETIMSLPRKLLSRAEKKHIWALDDVSFSVKEGDSVAIMGHNGSGKSTLLKVLSRITEPTKGRAFIRGRVASMLEVGAGFHPELTGRENVFLNGSLLGLTRAEMEETFDDILQ